MLDLVVAHGSPTCSARPAELTRGAACPVGICLPELVTNDGEPGSAWNFEWRGLDFRTPLSAVRPVYFESDVRAAAFAEGWIGAGRDADIFVYVTLSTGMSHTLVIDGRPYGGARGFAIHFAGSELVAFGPAPDKDIEVRQHLEIVCQRQGHGRTLRRADRRSRCYGARTFSRRRLRPARPNLLRTRCCRSPPISVSSINILDPAILVIGGGIGSNPGDQRAPRRADAALHLRRSCAGYADRAGNARRQCLCDRRRCLGQQGRQTWRTE